MDDWQLLQEYAVRRNETAFTTLVSRYAPLVDSVARRHVNEPHLAEDVAQAVFILLARKANSLRRGSVLAGWLFQTTRFVAQRAMRSQQRRLCREQESLAMQQQLTPDAAWDRIAPAVDEALSQLNSADRDALLLRFYEGQTLREVGEKTGATEEAAKKRVSRALEKVRTILARRGISLSVAALGACMAEQAKAAVAPEVLVHLSRAALNSSMAPWLATQLAEEVTSAWRSAKLKIIAAISGTALILGLLSLSMADRHDASPENRTATKAAAPVITPARKIPRDTIAAPAVDTKILRFHVVDAATGQGIPNARVAYTIWAGWGNVEDHFDAVTNPFGTAAISYPSGTGRLDIGVVQDGFAARFATWPSEGITTIPGEYTLRLERVTKAVGGHILDSQGQPLANVTLWFQAHGTGDYAHRERPRERFGFLHEVPAVRTDAQGRWSLQFIPPEHPGFWLKARHPDFAETGIISAGAQQSFQEFEDEQVKQLWSGTLVTRMQPAFTLTGWVQDENGRRIPGARIQQREQSEIITADTSGMFRVPKLPAGPFSFTISAEGFAPERRTNEIGSNMQPVVVTLQPGAVLRLRVVDEFGAAVPGATVGMEQYGEHRHVLEWRTSTGPDGRVEWISAPRDADIELFVHKHGFPYVRDLKLKADGEEHVIQMRHALAVYGRVFDADSGNGIPDFRVVPGYGGHGNREERWFAGSTVRGTNGTFTLNFEELTGPLQVRVMADGYEDWISEPLTNQFGVTLDVPLKRFAPEDAVRGVVLKPDGTPAGGAQVGLLSFEHNVDLSPTLIFLGNKRWLAKSDTNGAFRFTPNRQAHSVAAVSRDGYAHLRVRDPHEPVTLSLQPFGRVEGTVDATARVHPVESIYLYDPAADNYEGRVSLLGNYRAKLDSEGRFVFEHVPPGEFSVFINSGVGIPYHHQTPVVVKPGDTTRVTIADRPGTSVTGQFLPPAGRAISWRKELVAAQFYLQPEGSPVAGLPASERPWRELEFWTSQAGRDYINSPRVYSIRLNDDGSFVSLDALPAGSYRFTTVFKTTSVTRQIMISEEQLPELGLDEIQLPSR